jgi:hypothetical protein
MRILNTQNHKHKDRSARLISIKFLSGEDAETTVWRGALPPYENWLDLWFDSTSADTVYAKVEEWNGLGGGLNCIQIYTED